MSVARALKAWAFGSALALSAWGVGLAQTTAPVQTKSEVAAASAGAVFRAVSQYCVREVPELASEIDSAASALAQRFQVAIQAEAAAIQEGAEPATEADQARLQATVARASAKAEENGQKNAARRPAYCREVLDRMNSLSLDQIRTYLKTTYQQKTAGRP